MSIRSLLSVALAAAVMVACSDNTPVPQPAPTQAEILASQGRSTTAIALSLSPSVEVSASVAGVSTKAEVAPMQDMGVFVISRLQYEALKKGDPQWYRNGDYQPYYNVHARAVAIDSRKGNEVTYKVEADTTLFFPLGARNIDEFSSGVHIFAYAPYRPELTLKQLIEGLPIEIDRDQTSLSSVNDNDFLWCETEARRQTEYADQQAISLRLQHKLARINVKLKLPITSVKSTDYLGLQAIRIKMHNCCTSSAYKPLTDSFIVSDTTAVVTILNDDDAQQLHDEIFEACNALRDGGRVVERQANVITTPLDKVRNIQFSVELVFNDRTATIRRNTLDQLTELTSGSTRNININLSPILDNNEGMEVRY